MTYYTKERKKKQGGNEWPFRICGDYIEWYSLRKLAWVTPQGSARHGYKVIAWKNVDGNMTFRDLHIVVWVTHFGPVPKNKEIDHIDGDKSNNTIGNLRVVTHAQNMGYARERLGNWCKRKIQSHQLELLLALPRHSGVVRYLAKRWGMHEYSLNNLRAKAKREKDTRYLGGL